jgi:hypothetical protein
MRMVELLGMRLMESISMIELEKVPRKMER